MFNNNGAQFVGLTPRPMKSEIIFSIRALKFLFPLLKGEISGFFNRLGVN